MVKTPPLLVSTTPPEKTKCSYSTDGKIQFTFNRPLETSVVNPLLNETFLFNLKRYNPITGLYDKSDVVSYDVVNTPTNSQCTLKNLPPGKYQATYQTVFPNDQNAGTTLNSELKNLNDFTIDSPPALKYTARMGQPKCATDGGDIALNARGGVPPYTYTITATKVVNGTKKPYTTSKVFTNSAGIPLPDHGLPNRDYIIPLAPGLEGDITIKVTDKQGCVDGDTKAP
jgi:hypothetical protein